MKMQNLFKDLEQLLLQCNDFNIDGKLNKPKIEEQALALEPQLLKILLNHVGLKKHFFQDVDSLLVFDKVKFQKFISNKQFLPDSYTQFKNKIGLTANSTYLTESKEVVLDFPYKDCVLQGCQDKEDAKRNEVFFNETLAPDDIDMLLEPKVLTNFKKYDATGEHKVTDLNTQDNLIIKGNNLLALHSLLSVYRGKVKLIYIDPPYNTGNDSFGYNDKFNHSTWLTFMKNRLEVARELLRDDGVIFVQCDDNEQAYLRVLMDNVFGINSFLNQVSVKMSAAAGLKMAHKTRRLIKIKEYLILYVKNIDNFQFSSIDSLYIEKDGYETERSDKYIENIEDSYDLWKLISLHQAFLKYALPDESKVDFVNRNDHRIYNHVVNKSTKAQWSKLSDIEKIEFTDRVRKYNNPGSDYEYAFNDHVLIPYNSKNLEGDMWTSNYAIGGTKSSEGGVSLDNGQKPERLIQRIIDLATNLGDIVLDYHLGSGTTAAVAHKMGRQYIGIEQMDYIEELVVTRLKNVIGTADNSKGFIELYKNFDNSGISKAVNWQGGGSFIYCELKQNNQLWVDKVISAISSDELLNIWQAMQDKAQLSYKVDVKTINAIVDDFKLLSLEEQKQFLLGIIDKNQLYINYTEIDDVDYQCSDEEKTLNNAFYGLK